MLMNWSAQHTHTHIYTQLQSQKLVKHRENSFSSFIFERRADLGCILHKKWEILFSLSVIWFIFVQLCWTLYFRSLPLLHLSLPWFQVSRQIWKKTHYTMRTKYIQTFWHRVGCTFPSTKRWPSTGCCCSFPTWFLSRGLMKNSKLTSWKCI